MTPHEVVQRFVDCINAHDVAGLGESMTPDHSFIDSLGNTMRGREAMTDAWRQYFAMVPDYRIVVERFLDDESVIVAFGRAEGTFTSDGSLHEANAWCTPAAWRAVVRADGVAEWQVYADNEPIRQVMARLATTEQR
ncbi:MAG TPA: nuclear transport factor 2 family protein [Gemmatimonadaceae bacterium]|nr:nuclear transport factor 2 family protein [Gemmatimonadaceae bacterium]